MQPKFNMTREKTNQLSFKSYKNDSCIFQFHSQIEIYVVTQGEMEMLVDGQRKTLKEGEFSVALSYVGHDYKTPKSSNSFSIIIPPHLCEEFIEITNGKKLKTPFFNDKELFENILHCYNNIKKENINLVKQHALVNLILGLILEKGEFIEANPLSNNDLTNKILIFLNENYKTNISPISVAEHFGYSQGYISRYFKSCFGITLVRYISMLRLKNALYLINEYHHDISYCALESGFSSIRTFYRSFQNEFGCSPKMYIDKIKNSSTTQN